MKSDDESNHEAKDQPKEAEEYAFKVYFTPEEVLETTSKQNKDLFSDVQRQRAKVAKEKKDQPIASKFNIMDFAPKPATLFAKTGLKKGVLTRVAEQSNSEVKSLIKT